MQNPKIQPPFFYSLVHPITIINAEIHSLAYISQNHNININPQHSHTQKFTNHQDNFSCGFLANEFRTLIYQTLKQQIHSFNSQ